MNIINIQQAIEYQNSREDLPMYIALVGGAIVELKAQSLRGAKAEVSRRNPNTPAAILANGRVVAEKTAACGW